MKGTETRGAVTGPSQLCSVCQRGGAITRVGSQPGGHGPQIYFLLGSSGEGESGVRRHETENVEGTKSGGGGGGGQVEGRTEEGK